MICTEPACAKLNLALDILGKRPDGYHEMRMVMQSIDLADHVTVSTCPGKEIVVTTDLPSTSRRTSPSAPAWLAAAAMERRYCGFCGAFTCRI